MSKVSDFMWRNLLTDGYTSWMALKSFTSCLGSAGRLDSGNILVHNT
jgi:hypothetical protein